MEAADKKAAAEAEAHQQPNIVEDVRVVKASTLTAGLAERPRSSAARAARARIALPIETLGGCAGARRKGRSSRQGEKNERNTPGEVSFIIVLMPP